MARDGGVTVHLRDLIDYLLSRGNTVQVVTLRPWGDDLLPWEKRGVRFYGPKRGTLIKAALSLCTKPRLFSHLLTHALQCYRVLGLRAAVRVLGDGGLLASTPKADIYLAYHALPEGLSAAIFKTFHHHHAPLMTTVFGELHMHSEPQYLRLARLALNSADVLLAMSQRCAEGVANVGLSPEQVRVIYYGPQLERFHPDLDGTPIRERYGLGQSPVVLYTGRLSEITGIAVLIEAIPHILKRVPDCQFLITGKSSPYRERLEQRASELQLSDQLTFSGFVPASDLPLLYGASTLLVYPQSVPYGCMGYSILEAMASGKAVVGSNIAGVPEAIVDGETGLLVEPGEPKVLAEAIIKVLLDPELASQLGQKGRQRALELFDHRESLRQIGMIIDQFLNQ